MSPRALLTAAVALAMGVGGLASAAPAGPPAPYVAPPFADTCTVHRFHEGEQPPLDGYGEDPFCVDYRKRDITVDNGGAVRFALAEPARFAAAGRKCRYWQQDHWSIQVDRGFTAVARWDGSYWYDRGRGVGAVLLKNFRVAGQPVGARQMAALVGTVSPAAAEQIRRYGAGSHGAGGGMSFSLGGGDPTCPR
jgi:hypothetical protein